MWSRLRTCIYVRLLGPCFKTGRTWMCCTTQANIAITHNVYTSMQPAPGLHTARKLVCELHNMSGTVLPKYTCSPERTLTTTSIHICDVPNTVLHTRKDAPRSVWMYPNNSRQLAQLHINTPATISPASHTMSIVMYRIHVRITIFSKFFSQLPHGTC